MVDTRFAKYIDYINNTGQIPLKVEHFDDDHDPIGPMVRNDMARAGIIQMHEDGIYLRPDLVRRA